MRPWKESRSGMPIRALLFGDWELVEIAKAVDLSDTTQSEGSVKKEERVAVLKRSRFRWP